MKHIYDLGDEITISYDKQTYFNGAQGIIKDIITVGGNTLYGVVLTVGNKFVHVSDKIFYFLAKEFK